MDWLLAYDSWCLDKVEALLKWLEEWLSISQKHTEQGMIVLYSLLMMSSAVLTIKGHTSIFVVAGVHAMIGTAMYTMHRKPVVMRQWARTSRVSKLGRLSIQGFLTGVAVLCLLEPPHNWVADLARTAGQFLYVVFYYMIDIDSGGERGKKRKLALAELKKLFGTEWIPKPVPVPN